MRMTNSTKAALKREQICDRWFSGWKNEQWRASSEEPGFAIVPRTLNLIALLTKLLSDKKGDPSIVYIDLWLRSFDGLVDVRDEREFAYACGFSPERGKRSWRERITWLEKQGFIRTVARWSDSISHIFLVNPDKVVAKLDEKNKLPDAWRKEYEMKMTEIKAKRWQPPKETVIKEKQSRSSENEIAQVVSIPRSA